MGEATGEKPKMWDPRSSASAAHYKYETGREGDMPIVSFSPRKAATALYGLSGSSAAKPLLAKLGKHTGKGCLHIKKLASVDHGVLKRLIESFRKSVARETLGRMHPRLAVLAPEQLVGRIIAGHALCLGIPGQRPAQAHGDVGEDATGRRDVALFDVGHRFAARRNRGEKILHVVANRGGAVLFQVFLRLVLGILL